MGYKKATRTNNGILYSSVGYTNPKLGFVSRGLNGEIHKDISAIIGLNDSTDVIKDIKTYNYEYTNDVREAMMKINPMSSSNHWQFLQVHPSNENSSSVHYENVFRPSANILTNFNNYKFVYNEKIPIVEGYETIEGTDDNGQSTKDKQKYRRKQIYVKVSPSLFNPLFMVQHVGITPNTPLLNTAKSNNGAIGPIINDLSNCTIKELVSQSYKPNSILGLATYRYIDFMYCKDLGKIANNHLITLRKFPYPIGDNIFQHYDESAADVGRLVTWFGTEDNKLEDILNFQYQMSWKELTSKIEDIESKENDSNRGYMGMLINTINPKYNAMIKSGQMSSNKQNLFGYLEIDDGQHTVEEEKLLRNYDNNKVYTPKNIIQDTVLYEGKLTFTHEFTLTFRYKLRAYDSINPRSAFLDLIGNIMNVTYRRGKFWGGDRKFIGPPQNTSAWRKVNSMIDGAWNKSAGLLGGLGSGSLKLGDILGAITGGISSLWGGVKSFWTSLTKNKDGSTPDGFLDKMKNFIGQTGLADGALGVLKNKLGRPALYAMDSLLTGDNVGLWHVTIGNPKNPIAVMGNLIMTNAQFQTSGPLGLDDFPTEIRVTVTLKHARSRDAVEIGRMFTKGTNGIYYPLQGSNINKWFPNYMKTGGDVINDEKEGITTHVNFEADTINVRNEDNRYEELAANYAAEKESEKHATSNIDTGYAAKIDQTNQQLMYDLAVVLDELA